MNSVSALRELASAAGMAEKRTDSRTSEQTIMKSFPDGKLLKTINFIVNSKRGLDGLTASAGNSYFGSMGVAQSSGGYVMTDGRSKHIWSTLSITILKTMQVRKDTMRCQVLQFKKNGKTSYYINPTTGNTASSSKNDFGKLTVQRI